VNASPTANTLAAVIVPNAIDRFMALPPEERR
jgi:hypothetical protein